MGAEELCSSLGIKAVSLTGRIGAILEITAPFNLPPTASSSSKSTELTAMRQVHFIQRPGTVVNSADTAPDLKGLTS